MARKLNKRWKIYIMLLAAVIGTAGFIIFQNPAKAYAFPTNSTPLDDFNRANSSTASNPMSSSTGNSAVGTVTLTHPKELNGLQTAVANIKQTLIFVKPDKNLTDQQWKSFFNSLEVDS